MEYNLTYEELKKRLMELKARIRDLTKEELVEFKKLLQEERQRLIDDCYRIKYKLQ